MAHHGKVKVGIIGSQFEADIHAASFRIMPEEAEGKGCKVELPFRPSNVRLPIDLWLNH